MQTMNLKIDDSIFPFFREMIDGFIQNHKIEIIQDDTPPELLTNSIEEVQKRVHAAEKRVNSGELLDETEYRNNMDSFLKSL